MIAAGFAVARGVTSARLRRLARTPGAQNWSSLGLEPDGRPAVVAFSTASCAECRVQERQLRRVAGVRVVSLDAADRSDLAGRFGVLTVPATVVLDADGSVAAVNHGLVDAARLQSQLAGGASERAAAG